MIRCMRAAIIAVGSELLGADRSDTNSLFLAEVLSRFGVPLVRKVIVGDVLADLESEIGRARADASLVLISGGLGPTRDDLTREAVASALGRRLQREPGIVKELRSKFASFGREMPKVNEKQADVIEGATVLANARGTAPGLRVEAGSEVLFLFPGVPDELHGLVRKYLEPWLAQNSTGQALERRVLRLACIAESELEERLAPLYGEFGAGGVSVLPSPGEVTIRLTKTGTEEERRAWLNPRAERLGELVGEFVFGTREEASLEAEVGRLLLAAGKTVVTAESCTGGGLAERLTAVAGSSGYFLGSVVTYSNRLKERLLGVPKEALETHGAVSSEVAKEMALGVQSRLGGDYGLALTGIAGPGGGTVDKPVGTVFVALARPTGSGAVDVRRLRLPGDRARIRHLTTQWALDMLRREVRSPTA